MKITFLATSTLLAFAGVCSAHFDLDSPAPRAGTQDLTELVPPCGGLPLGNRTVIAPVEGVFHITGELEHPTAQTNFSLYIGSDDPTQAQFTTYFDNGYNITLHLGAFNFTANVGDIPAVVNGANAVIQVAMFTPDGHLTACADIVEPCQTFLLSASTGDSSTTTGSFTSAKSGTRASVVASAGLLALVAVLIF
ncbi:hypothetical protein HK100_004819 [Physocladia obscura]|uniref:Copper acquisition factor BIM1-like domain-containing protein n=1 Tax=Physocladia obscura TaxID=109957 RepID=A0AAD5XKT6_9FUNG|nr:hypothetical protein HK100_004819 [Physocladia obscura]